MAGPVVSGSTLTPGFYMRVDLVAGDAAIGSAPRRACVIAVRGSSGTAVANEVNSAVAGADAVSGLVGAGTPGHLACKALFAENRRALVDFIAVAEPSGGGTAKASGTITLDDTSPVTSTRTITVYICGRKVISYWLAAQLDVDAATVLVAEINKLDADLPVVASNGGGTLAVVTLTAKVKGTWGNDVIFSVSMSGGAGGTLAASGTNLTSGVGEIDIATALSNIASTKYHLILLCTSNTDADAASSSSGPAKLKAHIALYNNGLNAKLQQGIVGITGSLSSAKTGTAYINAGFMQHVFFRAARSLGCEFGGAETGARLREESIDVNVNRTNRRDMPYLVVLYAPANITADALTDSELEDALQSGLSAGVYTDTGVCFLSIPRTTYWKDTAGNPDHRLVFVSQTTSLYAVADDLAAYLPFRFPDSKLTPDQADGDEDLPPKVVEESTIARVVIARVSQWSQRGVVDAAKFSKAIKDRTFFVKVDAVNPTKCNIQLPLSIIPPLTIWDVNVLGGL
jgi:phage tail sheath gpL-like